MNQVAINYVSSLIFHFLGPSWVLSRVLPFTQFYPGFTQLLR